MSLEYIPKIVQRSLNKYDTILVNHENSKELDRKD